MAAVPAIHFREVSHRLADGRLLLDRITLEVPTGSTTVLLGRSGSGKTTLLRMVNALEEPTSGEVRVRGRVVREQDPIALRRSIGYVIQETGLFPHFSVGRNVSLALEVEGRPRAALRARAAELLEMVGLEPARYASRMPWALSGGQRQRVGLARALAAAQDILLMDEPFGALDPVTRAEMQDVLLRLTHQPSRPRTTVLLVTHDLEEALFLAEGDSDRIVLLDEGRVAADTAGRDFLCCGVPAVDAYVSAARRGSGRRAGGTLEARR